jgi:hypothetical protein
MKLSASRANIPAGATADAVDGWVSPASLRCQTLKYNNLVSGRNRCFSRNYKRHRVVALSYA